MIETLKPPTDSLYKFLAIIGLIMFISSFATPIILNRQLNAQYAEFLTGKKSDRIEQQMIKVRARLQEAFGPNSKTSPTEAKQLIKEAEGLLKAQTETIALLRQQLNQWSKQDLEVQYKKNLLENYKEYASKMFTMCALAGPVGFFMSLMGFVLWYRRAQKYEDLVLKKKVEEPAESRIIIP